MNLKSITCTLASIGLVATAWLVGATPAGADTGDTTTSTVVTTRMIVSGYDDATAAANGFKIVVAADGTPTSIPVTKNALKIAQAYSTPAQPGAFSQLGTLPGDCGFSSLFITKAGSSGLSVSTGYSVYTTSVYQKWDVDGATNSGTWSEPFTGYNFSNTWTAVHVVPVISNTSGFGKVRAGSYARLINGLSCTSAGPSARW
jgi:hypothetical protein